MSYAWDIVSNVLGVLIGLLLINMTLIGFGSSWRFGLYRKDESP